MKVCVMFSIMCQVLEYYFEHFKITMKYSLIFVYSTCPRWPALGGRAPHGIEIPTGRTETAMASERDKL